MKSFVELNSGTRTQAVDVPLVFHSSISKKIGETPPASLNRKSPPAGEANWRYEKPGRFVPRLTRTGKFNSASPRLYPDNTSFMREPNDCGSIVIVLNCEEAGAQASPLEFVA